MDNVWNVEAWSELKNSFPDSINGSRILITSCRSDVALQIEPDCDPHFLRPFSDYESWKLLVEKIFQGEGCPEELLLVGEQIAQQCKGLPLSVVVVAGLLERTEKRKECWEKVAESLSSDKMEDLEARCPDKMEDLEARCLKILELSYRYLPGYLKACFLYLAVFIEDRDIPVDKLIKFWLAEGLVQGTQSNNLEDAAQDYLKDLISRSLMTISKRKSNGDVKACRLHDRLHDLFKWVDLPPLVTTYDEPYASFPDSNYGFDLYFDHQLQPVTYEAYRLSIFLKRNHFVESRPSGLGTRSLIFFASADSEPRCPHDISFICYNFKFLRVLDLECINMGISFPFEIGLLVGLRYLAVSGYVRSIPQSIANLRNLETLVVKGLRGKVVLPVTIWHMKRLRHLHVNKHVAFNWDDELLGGHFQLENLVSFSCPSLSCGEDAEKILKRFPNLCKLRCMLFESWDSSKICNQLPRFNFLTHLESLNIFYYGRALDASKFILPFKLKNLTLSNFHLPWSYTSVIGRLPHLQVLKLLSGAFEGQIWHLGEQEFRELVFLKLDTLNIVQWSAFSYHFPKLQHLIIQNCKDLLKVPYDFVHIPKLQRIEVLWSGQCTEESAKKIGEATGKIKVVINSL
ncbi:putative late blight resistance protein homolog R1B-17 [Coffea arabica]|uniref:Late blight resistance protein homolog R1B-17 n=1 Tax=Coffea arabica TaxID=13443 RepID=A0ABM4X9N0_COFAR